MSYWDAYDLPVPVRHYWIERFNKSKKPAGPAVDEPLNEAQKSKLVKDVRKASNSATPIDHSTLMQSRRNRK